MFFDFLATVIASAFVSLVLCALMLWLFRAWVGERLKNAIKSEYDQKLETHKAQLKAQADVEIEKLRSQLNIATTEHEVRFSRLHEKRAEVIAETYSLLKELFLRLEDYVKLFEPAGGTPREQRRKSAIEGRRKFDLYYRSKLIFFPKATAEKLDNINRELVNTFNQFTFGVEIPLRAQTENIGKWVAIVERVQKEIKTALDELEDEFRRLLGDIS